ncbi:hypothetical protein CDAR_394271 [Caerostris darwini]|uniref:Uncharacterized protein n=1 Tax=Caerostris darwini TaxID=1538125 RepID=A0AAV4RIQ8_9ARAC|nr:hypothetical protein CDAR_394271 [Caerostris darwini]
MHLRLVVSFNSTKRQIKKNFYPFHCIVLCSFWNKSAGARWGGCEEEKGEGGGALGERCNGRRYPSTSTAGVPLSAKRKRYVSPIANMGYLMLGIINLYLQ